MFCLVIFSVYSLLLFGELCHPDDDEDDPRETFHWSKEISCTNSSEGLTFWSKKLHESIFDHDFRLDYNIV